MCDLFRLFVSFTNVSVAAAERFQWVWWLVPVSNGVSFLCDVILVSRLGVGSSLRIARVVSVLSEISICLEVAISTDKPQLHIGFSDHLQLFQNVLSILIFLHCGGVLRQYGIGAPCHRLFGPYTSREEHGSHCH